MSDETRTIVQPQSRHGLPCAALCLAAITLFAATGQAADVQNPPTQADTFSSRKDNKDGSASGTLGVRLPTEWETKLGVDIGTAAPATTEIDPDRLLQVPAKNNGSSSGWARATLPGLGWDKTTIDARLDSVHDLGKVGTTLSRSVPLGGDVSMTLQSGYALTRSFDSGASSSAPSVGDSAAVVPAEGWESGRGIVVKILPTATTLSADEKRSNTDEKWLRTFSAEQKLYGPLSVTGSVSETATGEANKSVTAGFKTRW